MKLKMIELILCTKEWIEMIKCLTYFITANNTISCESFKANATHGTSWSC